MHVVSNHYIPEIFTYNGNHLVKTNYTKKKLKPTILATIFGTK